jgi:6-phosphofructokinase 1
MNIRTQEHDMMKAFLCHAGEDAEFVIEVAKHLKHSLDTVYYYEAHQRSNQSFIQTINEALEDCQVMVVFVGETFTNWQGAEVDAVFEPNPDRHFFTILLKGQDRLPTRLKMLQRHPRARVDQDKPVEEEAYRIARWIVHMLERSWRSDDDLPLNPHLFDYEKDTIEFFINKARLEAKIGRVRSELSAQIENGLDTKDLEAQLEQLYEEYEPIRQKQLQGCPVTWPQVTRWTDGLTENKLDEWDVGNFRPVDAQVVAAALSRYHHPDQETCMLREKLCFPEAGPRQDIAYPRRGQNLNVAVIVSGGIAPGINSVIAAITQRHQTYADKHEYNVHVYGLKNGFQAFDNLGEALCRLTVDQDGVVPARGGRYALEVLGHTNEGGSILGTSRYEALMDIESRQQRLEHIVQMLLTLPIDILYVIGGDGSMKAAHAIWSFANRRAEDGNADRRLSVVAIPKTMDNDILWVWQSFGFLSAVERAREVIEHLGTEVRSNPRLGVVQLFGSDSGFVVSHAVLASRTGICDAALIPEADFSMAKLASYMKDKMCTRERERTPSGRIPYGFVVLAETAIPTDAMDYVNDPEIGLTDEEKLAVLNFNRLRANEERIQGQTDDALRTAGLRIVSRGLKKLLPSIAMQAPVQPDWSKLRVFTNEPRHLLRATAPSSSDMITAQRLGMLAVDNALAGYTDFMISQWLTEYVLVPLKLAVLGRKRIPKSGIFWKSVLAKTGQPFDLVSP